MPKDGLTIRPWYRWSPRDFYADPVVCRMTREQRWRYRDALDASWVGDTPGEWPEDEWRKSLGYSAVEWSGQRDVFAAAFVEREGQWVQKRLLAEAEHWRRHREASSAGGKRGQGTHRAKSTSSTLQVPLECTSSTLEGELKGTYRETSEEAEKSEKEEPTLCLAPLDGDGRDVSATPPRQVRRYLAELDSEAEADWRQFFVDHVWPSRPRLGAPGPKVSESRELAERAWMKRRPKDSSEDAIADAANRILNAMEADKQAMDAADTPGSKRPHLSTYLNGARWEDA